ncbi:MAG: OB-fold nucleic acid binding domain-containing protein, partial [Sedimentisphaerales bacterium]|nr:OB-fold nucleic acid binding domain-containing protein [Sedimentisphaerales bacterium]
MLSLDTNIAAIPRIRKTTAEKFTALGIRTVEDLLWHLPFRYDDFSTITPIKDITMGAQATFRGTVKTIHNRNAWRRRLRMTEAIVSDETGSIAVLWFNQPYLTRVLASGDVVLCSGKAKRISGRLTVSAPAWEKRIS